MTVSRTFLLNCIILFILLLGIRFFYNKKNIYYRFAIFAMPLLLFISYVLCHNYSSFSSFYLNLDNILSRRLSLSHYALNYYGITFLPKTINYSLLVYEKNRYVMYMVIDNIYIRFFISYGLISFSLLYLSFFSFIKRIKQSCNCLIFYVFIIIYSIYGFTEIFTVNVCLCFPLLFLGSFILDEEVHNESINNNACI